MSTWIKVAAVAALGVLAAPSVAQAAPTGTSALGGRPTVAGVGQVALVVPEGVGPIKNHAFAMKIIDGGTHPDQVAFIQASGGADRPPTGCFDFDVEYPGILRLQVSVGGYAVHGH